jgi:hypothetical protein
MLNESNAQVDPTYFDKTTNLKLYGGLTIPSQEFSNTSSNGGLATNAYQIGFEINSIIKYGIGVGLDVGVDKYGFDYMAFNNYANAQTIETIGRYSSTFFGLNLSYNLPIKITRNFALKVFGIGSAGLRGMRIPEIDLTYDEINNKYVEVSYRPRSSTMGYLSYRAGIEFIFNERWGISTSYKSVVRSQHRIYYSTRSFDTAGELYESEDFLSTYLDSKSYQIGVLLQF